MSATDTLSDSKTFCFATLKISRKILGEEPLAELFQKRAYCDQFIRSLIHFIDHKKFLLYGFVILADEIHLIINCEFETVGPTIEELKKHSAKETLLLMGKILNSMDDISSRKQIELRKIFSSFLNEDEFVFWQDQNQPIILNIQNAHIKPITSEILHAHLADDARNYLQLGANAFTKLMLDTMKI